MSLISKPIPGFYNGVSQQPASLRLDTQLESQVNGLGTLVDGLGKRAGSTLRASLAGALSFSPNYLYHKAYRDKSERYIMVFTGDAGTPLMVWTSGGDACSVSYEGSTKSYLTTSGEKARETIRCCTIADHTFVANTAKTVAMADELCGPLLDNSGASNPVSTQQKLSDCGGANNVTSNSVWKIEGDNTSNFDNYYVLSAINPTGPNTWKECALPGIKYKLDKTTMPVAVVRTGVNTFTVKELEWDERKVGDADTAPEPSFVGDKLQGITFHKNRLVLFTKTNVVMSKAGDYYNFFPTTALEALDDDPIDVGMNATADVPALNWAVPFDDRLMLFTDTGQLSLGSGNSPLTPNTTAITQAAGFDSAWDTRPFRLGPNLYFPQNKQRFTAIREYFIQADTLVDDAADTTAHCPNYIPVGFISMAGCSTLDMLFVHSTGDPKAIYVYKFYWNGNQKAQSAWSRWVFTDDVVCMMVFDTDLYIVTGAGTLEVMNLDKAFTGELGFHVHLDRLKEYTSALSGTTSSLTLPYSTTVDALQFVEAGTGRELTGWTQSGDTYSLAGSPLVDGAGVYVGLRYPHSFELTRWYPKAVENAAAISDIVQMKNLILAFHDTGYFKVECLAEGRDPLVSEFNAIVLGAVTIGSVPVLAGEYRFPLIGSTKTTRVVISNDTYLPSSFQTGTLEGILSRRSQTVK